MKREWTNSTQKDMKLTKKENGKGEREERKGTKGGKRKQ